MYRNYTKVTNITNLNSTFDGVYNGGFGDINIDNFTSIDSFEEVVDDILLDISLGIEQMNIASYEILESDSSDNYDFILAENGLYIVDENNLPIW